MHWLLPDFYAKVEEATYHEHAANGDDVPDQVFSLEVLGLVSEFLGLFWRVVQSDQIDSEVEAPHEESDRCSP